MDEDDILIIAVTRLDKQTLNSVKGDAAVCFHAENKLIFDNELSNDDFTYVRARDSM